MEKLICIKSTSVDMFVLMSMHTCVHIPLPPTHTHVGVTGQIYIRTSTKTKTTEIHNLSILQCQGDVYARINARCSIPGKNQDRE